MIQLEVTAMFSTASKCEAVPHEVFNALASAVRLEIVDLLSTKGRTLSELSSHFGASPPAVLYHMKVLGHAGIISRKKSGRCVEYALIRKTVIAPISDYVRDLGCVHQ
jgi:DNA-binding transcriptional ArsR family regulator